MEYATGTQIPLVVCGDLNAMTDSGVYDLLAHGSIPGSHSDLQGRTYGDFTRQGMSHPFKLRSAYGNIGELRFTNYTPNFTEVIDYIWYSTTTLQVTGLLGEVDKEYLLRVPGFPNYHFPSDHLALLAEFVVKGRKEKRGGGVGGGVGGGGGEASSGMGMAMGMGGLAGASGSGSGIGKGEKGGGGGMG